MQGKDKDGSGDGGCMSCRRKRRMVRERERKSISEEQDEEAEKAYEKQRLRAKIQSLRDNDNYEAIKCHGLPRRHASLSCSVLTQPSVNIANVKQRRQEGEGPSLQASLT